MPNKIDRATLAKIAPDPQSLKAFESLFATSDANDAALAVVTGLVADAQKSANDANAEIARIESSIGSSLIGFKPDGANYKSRILLEKLLDITSIFDSLTEAQISDVRSRSVTFDLTAALQAALNSFGPNGGTLLLLPGAYKYTFLNVPDNVTIKGSGRSSTILYCVQLTDNTIVLHSGSGIEDVTLSSSAARTGGRNVIIDGNASYLQRVTLYNYYIGVDVVNSAVGVEISSVIFGLPSLTLGGAMILGTSYSNLTITKVIGSGTNSGPQPSYGIRLINGDTSFISDTNITRHGAALSLSNLVNTNIFATHVSNSLFDSAVGNSCCEMLPLGGVYDTKFSNCWFGLGNQSGCLINPQGSGLVDGVGFGNCEFPANGDSGLRVNGTSAINIFVDGGWASANQYGYNFSGGCTHFRLNGVRSGNVSARGGNTNGGVNIQAGASDYYTITNSDLTLNGGGNLLDFGTGTHKVIANNLT